MSLSIQNIHKMLYEFRATGKTEDDLEAILIHSDDLKELMQAVQEKDTDIGVPWSMDWKKTGEIRIMGVKIIESTYIQRGTIFKIMKNEAPFPTPPHILDIEGSPGTWPSDIPGFFGPGPPTVAGSGMIPGVSPKIAAELGWDTEYKSNQHFEVPSQDAAEKVEKKVEKRHSTKRNIELD